MPNAQDIVFLDGYAANGPWPLELAEAFLDAPSPDRAVHAFLQLASWVNAYNREEPDPLNPIDRPGAFKVARQIEQVSSLTRFCTQDLLDALFYFYRRDYWTSGDGSSIVEVLPKLREIVREVVRRVRSDQPPTFVLQNSQNS
ncbi:hypothetical protein KSC_056890 [Ktedonobacter sp. SOSP1-52]|uniref:hypothetical protein n=1 Tax=Ktedonobacter sp. SOSP1-52 TaxID=2778366 RepID=UPI001916B901|nr:hypothetical protein [Ktedonobacter sp. SOSP1-52]GHO66797.1 hypothetical protein KSC_056890 [Ktedonobacter sp. SOSP1-52]